MTRIWASEAKLRRWQDTELAIIQARVLLGLVEQSIFDEIKAVLEANPPDVEWWLKRDSEIHHDLNAFIEERRRHLRLELRFYFHQDITSYDTEESSFVLALQESNGLVKESIQLFENALTECAGKYRYHVFFDRTHGQGAKLRTFGGRALTWKADFSKAVESFGLAQNNCKLSRVAGAIGNYGGNLSVELERTALGLLGLEPFYGSTQIMPRVLYAPLADSICYMAAILDQIARTIRLSARSGMPLCHEPFGSVQKGSSAMPHKKNPILCEQMKGMARMAKSYANAIRENINTWESRAIEQSCVERIAWPDLYHVIMRMLTVMTKVVRGLVVYPDNMFREIIESRGTYASEEAKGFLEKKLGERGEEAETAYRIVQAASFTAFDPQGLWKKIRSAKPESLSAADDLLESAQQVLSPSDTGIQEIIRNGWIKIHDQLQTPQEKIDQWNKLLRDLFSDETVTREWSEVFKPSNLLKSEPELFRQLL